MYKIKYVFLIFFFITCNTPTINFNMDFKKEIVALFVVGKQSQSAYGMISFTQNPINYDFYQLELNYDANVYLNNQKFDTVGIDSKKHFSFFYNYNLKNIPINSGDSLYLTIIFPSNHDTTSGISIMPTDKPTITISEDENYFYFHWDPVIGESYEWLVYENINGEFLQIGNSYVGKSSQGSLEKNRINDINNQFKFVLFSYDYNLTQYKLYHQDPAGLNKHYGIFFSVSYNIFLVNLKQLKWTLISNDLKTENIFLKVLSHLQQR